MSWEWKTIIEPFKIKSVEPLGFTTREERYGHLRDASFNLFNLPADKVLIDLLTDSGTSAMSAEQWAALMRGDESYAGARSFFVFEKVVRELTGLAEVIPVHQGRAAERILFSFVGGTGKTVISNAHFDTTRANIESSGAEALDLPVPEAMDFQNPSPFKGDIDTRALEAAIRERGPKNIPLVILTLTNNALGGQPVSMRNIRDTAEICSQYRIPLFLDCARFAENAYLIKRREQGYASRPVVDIVKEIFSYAQGAMMSAKKDALVNIGGFLALRDPEWAKLARQELIVGEGFPTYGGLAGRDLEAMAQGLREILDEEYLSYRIRSVEYLGEGLKDAGVPIVVPTGGHAVYVDAKAFLPHVPPDQFPGQSLACELYLAGGIRAVEIGSLMFGKREGANFTPAKMELLRLALPRRVYTQSHMDFVIEVFQELVNRRDTMRGLKLLEGAKHLNHFLAKLAPL